MNTKDKVVVTAALPYANGHIHIGHLLEYIQADIYARFLKLIGKDALYICASDMHGTPIEINAKKAGIEPEKFVDTFWKEHQADFASFQIKFDNYYKTHSPENKELAIEFFEELKQKGYITTKEMQIMYCETDKRSLPDRFVKGTCPKCGAEDQYGDVCEKCNAVLKGIDLINPYCITCKNTPIQKASTHYFFTLSKFAEKLQVWIDNKESEIQPEVRNWLTEWIKNGLDDWCISRDAPYFGFKIPNSKEETGEQKYFYVWLDAPIGYLSSLKNYCDKHGKDWEDYLHNGTLMHFIGKDIAYFHYLFWPAEFMALDFPLPKLNAHGFITVNGQKMSKSRGTFFTAKDFLSKYTAESLRFYYALHLDRKIVDVDLNFDEFIAVNNNVLMGNLGNFCYRVLSFAKKNYGEVGSIVDDKEFFTKVQKLVEETKQAYAQLDFKTATKNILAIADLGNAYFQQAEPWKNKDDPRTEAKVIVCVVLARNLSILTQPILPEFSKKVQAAFGVNPEDQPLLWDDINFNWIGKLQQVEKLIDKIEPKPEDETAKENASKNLFPLDLHVGHILEVNDHPNADSLFLFKVDFGKDIGIKQVVTSLKKHLAKEAFENKKLVFCLNLKPAKFRGELSEAMVLAADNEQEVKAAAENSEQIEHIIKPLEVPDAVIGENITPEGVDANNNQITFKDVEKVIMSVKKGIIVVDSQEGKKLQGSFGDVKISDLPDGTRVY